MYGAVLKPCGGRTEDKVGGALNIAVFEIHSEPFAGGEHRVLMSQQAAVDKAQSVAIGVQSHCLSQSCRIVLDGDVLESDIIAIHPHGIGAEGAHPFGTLRDGDVGMVIVCDDGFVAVFAQNLDIGEPSRHDELLLVGAFLHKDHLVIVHVGAAHLKGVVNVSELSCTVACHHQGIRIVVLACSLCRQGGDDGEQD